MSAIHSRGPGTFTTILNWRLEDDTLDPYELKIALWIASHADHYLRDHVTRNEIAKRTHISGPKVSAAITRLSQLGIIEVETLPSAHGRPRWVITFDLTVWHARSAAEAKGSVAPSKGSVAPFERERGSLMDGSHLPIGEEQGEEHSERALVVLGEDFDSFWSAYPRKVKKPAARKAWVAALKRVPVETVLLGASRVITLWQKYGYEQRFIPYASSWLNNDGWDDEVAPQATTKTAPGMGALRRILAEEQE